jgi:putative transposase
LGPDKIARVLRKRFGEDAPSRSTVARILRRLGKVKRRRPPVRLWTANERPHAEVAGSDDLWTIDFKGWWRARNGQRCEPLTVRDAYSRYVLAVSLLPSTRTAPVRHELERLFREHGTPRAILCDNGSPWVCTRTRGGLTHLSAWLVSLGIRLLRSRPAKPQDNGGHERMHRDLAELQLAPARSRRAQQQECDRWLVDFNHVRPHDALNGKTPVEVYRPCHRQPQARIPSYPAEYEVRRVNDYGAIKIHGDAPYISHSLHKQRWAVCDSQGGLRWRAYFHEVDLGLVEIAQIDDALSSLPLSEVKRTQHNEGIHKAATVST